MPHRTFDTLRRITERAIVKNNSLGGLFALIRRYQQSQAPGQRTRKSPKRRDQIERLFSLGKLVVRGEQLAAPNALAKVEGYGF